MSVAMADSEAPPPCPPSPVSPWHATQNRPYSSLPAATFGSPAGIGGKAGAAAAPAAGAVAAAPGRGGPPTIGNDSILPASENNQTLSPFLLPPNSVPADITATYCRPLWRNVLAVAFTPASVMNSHTLWPFVLSSAVKRPSLRPTKTRPPAVLIEPLKRPWLHA